MDINLFDYNLPTNLIAQLPTDIRGTSKMLIYDRANYTVSHKNIKDIITYLNKGDVLVINDTKVIPARIARIMQKR